MGNQCYIEEFNKVRLVEQSFTSIGNNEVEQTSNLLRKRILEIMVEIHLKK